MGKDQPKIVVTLLVLCFLGVLLGACGQQTDEERPPLPPLQMEARGALEMDQNTAASISLRGLPDEIISVDDGSGQMWLVVSGGLENVGVGTHVLLEGGGEGVRPEAIASYQWTLTGPAGSTAILDDPTSRTPIFIPDQPGLYELGLQISNDAGISGQPTSLTIHAGTFVGNGSVRGASDDPHQCIECHRENLESWEGTRHAETLQRAMDGQASPFYFENCIHCHTVGKNPIADNGGFDDLARELNWSYPEELKLGNYLAFKRAYPQLANLGNTQCEMCHGPGSAHEDDDNLIAISLRPELCIQCHDFLQQDQHAQWVRSGHADTTLPQLFPDGIDEPLCSTCHTTQSFIAAADGAEIVTGGEEYLSCQACHDPHAADPGSNFYQVRYYGSLQLPDGTTMRDVGSSALCIHCHNVGETPEWVEHEYDPLIPPPQSAASEMLAGVGGYTYGETLDNSPHVNSVKWNNYCVGCHMISSTPPDGESDFLSATMNEPIGEHTFQVRYDNNTPDDPSDDYQNLQACDGCHGEISQLNSPAADDYDGDSTIEGIQDEVQGLLDLVRDELMAAGVEWRDEAPYWGPAETEELRAGVYNWSYVNNDGSKGIHNTARAIELLQLSYRQLSGQEVPNAVLRAEKAPELRLQQRLAAERSPLKNLAWTHFVIPLAVLLLLAALGYIVLAAVRNK